ncbi:MAG: efflux RND transporter permease subunit [Gammaproteobacteria bacterium]|nr:efflux RND transporter permease subunit [Gammaproteobacteria bacterium]
MNWAQWASHHRRSILFLLAVIAIGGVISGLNLPVALFPQVSFPRIAVAIEAGDQPAAQMVTLVTRPVEQAIKAVPGLRSIRSTTSRGSAEMSLNFDWGLDMAVSTLQVQAEINRVLPALPAGTSFTVRRMNPNVFPVAAYSLTSNSLDLVKVREIAQYELVPLLSSITGVAQVEVHGGAAREVRVDADPGRLASYGLSMDDVAKSLSAANVLAAVGRTADRHKLLLALSDTQLTTPDQVRQVIVRSGPDGAIRLADVARVFETAAPSWTVVTADGHPAVIVQVKQQIDGNSVQIIRDVNRALSAYASRLPPDFKISNWYDQSELILGSAHSVFEAVLIGVALAGLVLFVFLRNLKITLITLIVVPAVLAATTLLLSVLGMSFNIMTLGGMAAAIGLIVDDAIVMIEQIERRLHSDGEEGRAQIRAAAWEFLKPLAGSSAATIVIFIPLAFLTGVTGAFFKALSLTLSAALIASFLVAYFVIPLLAEFVITSKEAQAEAHTGPALAWVLGRYRALFERLRARPWLLVPVIAAFLLLGGFAYTQVGSGFMPTQDEGGFVFDYLSPPGTSLQDTDAMLQQVEAILRSTPEVLTYSRRTGLQLGGGLTESNTGDIFVRLKPLPRRDIQVVMAEIRERVGRTIPGLDVETALLMEDLIGDLTAVPQPIEVKIFGDDPAALNAIAPQVAKAIAVVPGVTEIRDGVIIAGDALDIRVDPLKAGLEGLDPDQVTRQVKAFLSGTVATQLQNLDRSIDVRVWLPPEQRATPNDIRALRLTAPDGHLVPLGRVAQLQLVTGQPQITRENLKPMTAVTARIEGRDLGSTIADVKAVLAKSTLFSQGTYYELGGLYAQQQIAFRGLIGVLIAAFALVFFLLLYLYERFTLALLIIAMPLLAMAAVFMGLWLTGIELNISAMMGMTMVVGIVTEIAIFYFSEYELLVDDGMTHEAAIIAAGSNRLRPIAMTTIAAILALLPLALGLGQGSAMQQPLAIAIISGLMVQMPLVLIAMPIAFAHWTRRQTLAP